MKKEVARREIESLDYYLQNHTDDYGEESHTAMMMAVSALSDEDNTMEWKAIYDRTEVGDICIERLCGFECSKCNKQTEHMYNFCPHCGRKAVFE